MSPRASRHAFSRIELVVLIGIGIVLAGLLAPAVQKARAGANGSACQYNLRQIVWATYSYNDAYSRLPFGMDDQYVGPLVWLLPFLNQDDLFRNFSFNNMYALYWENPQNRPPSDGSDNIPRPPDIYGSEGEPDIFLCPDAPLSSETVTALMVARYGTAGVDYRNGDGLDDGHLYTASPGRLVMGRTHYLGMAGDWRDPLYRGAFRYRAVTRFPLPHASQTVFFAEYWGGVVNWNGQGGIPSGWSAASRSSGFNHSSFGTCPNPTNPNCDYDTSFGLGWAAFGALHGCKDKPLFNAGMGDGSVQSFRGDMDFIVWLNLCSLTGNGDPTLEPADAWLNSDF